MQDKDKELYSSDESHLPPQDEDEINLLDYLIVLAKHKKLILLITFGVAIITAIISLIMTPIYRAETKILPPQPSSSITSQMLSQLEGMAGLVGTSLGIKGKNEIFVELLKSRPVLDRIIDRFDLMNAYKAEYRDDARNILLGALKVRSDRKSGIITVGVEDKDPKKAADMANAFIEELKKLNKKLAITKASQRRLFFEDQLKDAKESLILAEESMKQFQEKTGALKLDAQTQAVIDGISQLRAQIAAKEVQLKVMKTYATPQNPDLQRVMEELRGMKEQLAKLEAKKGGHNPDPLMPTGRVPEVGTEYMRKLRDLKFYEKLYELLLKQYEAAKLDEAREPILIQVIEKAIPPKMRVKPKRRLMVMIATVTALFFSIFIAFIMEYIEKASKDPENRERLDSLRRYIGFKKKTGSGLES